MVGGMTKTIGVHDLAYMAFQRLVENLQERDKQSGGFMWKITAGRVLELLVWYFEESCKLQCEKCSSLVINFQPEVGNSGRPREGTDYRLLPYNYSLACKMIRAEKGLSHLPTHTEVIEFIKKNPDIGFSAERRRMEEELTKKAIVARGELPDATMKQNPINEWRESVSNTINAPGVDRRKRQREIDADRDGLYNKPDD